MNWIRKTVIFVSLLIIAFFACQANEFSVQKTETSKTDTTFSIERSSSLAFIQPQASYQFVANIKTSPLNFIKWFETILIVIPHHQAVKLVSNFSSQHFNQSKKVLLLLFPFHFFW